MKKLILGLFLFSLVSTSAHAKTIQYQETISSVVLLEVVDSQGEYYYGTGINISADAIIITAAHVLIDQATGLPAEYIDICFIENEYQIPECKYSAQTLAYDEDLDLAIIAPSYALDEDRNEIGDYIDIETALQLGLDYVDFADGLPELGERVTILGYPEPNITLSEGIVSGFIPLSDNLIWQIITDANVNPGNSGGPAYNDDERVIGVVNAYSVSGGGTYGYIIANDVIFNWFLELAEQGILIDEWVYEIFDNDSFSSAPELEQKDIDELEIFTDVTAKTDNAEAISYLKENEIIGGYEDGSFKPDNSLNRAELMKILVASGGYPANEDLHRNCFTDVQDQWFAKYVCYGKTRGWIKGYEDGSFRPAQEVTKAEAIKMLLEVMEIGKFTALEEVFKDSKMGNWYNDYLFTAERFGILEESQDSYYSPNKTITRKGISENIYRLLLLNEEYEKAAFISATVDFNCMEYNQEGDSEKLAVDVYNSYGFDALNDQYMVSLFEKYSDEEISIEVADRVLNNCPALYNELVNEMSTNG